MKHGGHMIQSYSSVGTNGLDQITYAISGRSRRWKGPELQIATGQNDRNSVHGKSKAVYSQRDELRL